eukprot:gb/GECG01006812.1/.p1 GENE.gb/GECG01006812.1/~~gb/GECG01006812.1/.p1  ORF type:complete len:125 (+),score=15.34 gb/GECG01006812.1/:1-375(+)
MYCRKTGVQRHFVPVIFVGILSILVDMRNVGVDGNDLREEIIAGKKAESNYSSDDMLFQMTDNYVTGCFEYMSMNSSEVFDGNDYSITFWCRAITGSGFFTNTNSFDGINVPSEVPQIKNFLCK